MNIERRIICFIAIILIVTGFSQFIQGLPSGLRDIGQLGFAVTLWIANGLFATPTLISLVILGLWGSRYDPPSAKHGPDEIQVRVLTIGAAEIVQATVDSIRDEFSDIHVIAEDSMSIDGATVHVVPNDFTCQAVRKGRAIEWARRTLHCDRQYVLYLDEDSIIAEFEGLPDADIVQLREQPRRSGAILPYLADVYRMGVQLEKRAFPLMRIPLFAWGGGFAVRKSVEDSVTWERESLVEDTAFLWAAEMKELSFELGKPICRNEAPPSMIEIMHQRRRWAAGNLQSSLMLPLSYRLLVRSRIMAWALSPIVMLLALPWAIVGPPVLYRGPYLLLVGVLTGFTGLWYLLGVSYYPRRSAWWALALPVAPLVTLVHSFGTTVGVLTPPEEFRVTTKTGKNEPDE